MSCHNEMMTDDVRSGPQSVEQHIARRLYIFGLVQGVYYRDSCRREAIELGITGYAHNLEDGSVEAHLEGEPPAVATLIAWCHRGPERARVDRVIVLEAALM